MRFPLGFSACVALALVTAGRAQGEGLLVRRPAPVGCGEWRLPRIFGRDYWAVFRDYDGKWTGPNGGCPGDLEMFREAGIVYTQDVDRRDIPDAPRSQRRLLGVNDWMAADRYRPDWVTAVPEEVRRTTSYRLTDFGVNGLNDHARPFWIELQESRPPFFLKDAYPLADRADYVQWKARYPNFAGFMTLDEFDSEVLHYGYFLDADRVADESVRSHFKTRFPSSGRGWNVQSWLKTCYASCTNFHFGETRLWSMNSGVCGLLPMSAALGNGGFVYEATTQSHAPWQLAGAFARGAARQNGVPFGWFMANFYQGFTRQGEMVKGENRWCDFHHWKSPRTGPDMGAGETMLQRQLVYGLLIGAGFFQVENWPLYDAIEENGKFVPSKEARNADEIYRLFKRVDRGVSYTPIALLVPIDEPIWTNSWGEQLRDRYSQLAFFHTLVPLFCDSRWAAVNRRGFQGCLYNSEFGEIFDVFCPDRGQDTEMTARKLGEYACAFLVGDGFDLTKIDRVALSRYVEDGGTLVVSVDQVRAGLVGKALSGLELSDDTVALGRELRDACGAEPLEDGYVARVVNPISARAVATDEKGVTAIWSNDVGKGRVLTVACEKCLPKRYSDERKLENYEVEFKDISSCRRRFGLLHYLFKRVQEETLPIGVHGPVQFGVNKTSRGLLVWLFNNDGVIKWSLEPEVYDASKTAEVELDLKGRQNIEVRDERTGETVGVVDGKAKLQVRPGGWRILSLRKKNLP